MVTKARKASHIFVHKKFHPKYQRNPFLPDVHSRSPLKTSENLWFPDVSCQGGSKGNIGKKKGNSQQLITCPNLTITLYGSLKCAQSQQFRQPDNVK